MTKNIAVGIDIGSQNIKVAIVEKSVTNGKVSRRLIGAGIAESRGLRKGHITNPQEVARGLHKAIRQAEKASGMKIERAFISVGGVTLEGHSSSGSVVISRPDMEIINEDVQQAMANSSLSLPRHITLNKKILHEIPVRYKIDGREIIGRPHGMKGSKLEVQTLFITCAEQHIDDLIQVVEGVGVRVVDAAPAPIAASFVTLSKAQKLAGCVLANIGAETVSIVVYENNLPISLEVFPIGSNDITNDIALGFKISLEEAEKIKLGQPTGSGYPRNEIDKIVNARLEEIFELIEGHLQKIGKHQLLPAGIIITGGGAGLPGVQEMAKASLSLPSMIARPEMIHTSRNLLKDAIWSVSYGLCILDLSSGDEEKSKRSFSFGFFKKALDWLRQFLP